MVPVNHSFLRSKFQANLGLSHSFRQLDSISQPCFPEKIDSSFVWADLLIMLQRAALLLGREGGMSENFGRNRRKGEDGRKKKEAKKKKEKRAGNRKRKRKEK